MAGPDVEDTNDAKLDCHGEHTPNVDSAATEVWHQKEPVAKTAEECKTVGSDTQTVGLLGG